MCSNQGDARAALDFFKWIWHWDVLGEWVRRARMGSNQVEYAYYYALIDVFHRYRYRAVCKRQLRATRQSCTPSHGSSLGKQLHAQT
jgi:hypothetical protein